MGLITKLFDIDLTNFVPEMDKFLGSIKALLVLAVLIGPILLLTLGAMYLFKPVPEANFKYGFRTYFGMGSVEAWQFAQRMGGMVFGGLGAVLLLAMLITVMFFGKSLSRAANIAAVCLICQTVLTLIARSVVAILAAVYFDKDGNRRR